FCLLTEFGRLVLASLLFADVGQPIEHIAAIPDLVDGKSFSQNLFGALPVLELGARESVTIRPPDPAPSPAWIGVQPIAIERFGFAGLAQLEIRLRQCAPPVLGHQVIFRRKTPQPFFTHCDPGGQELPVLLPCIPQRVFQILNPIEQRLRSSEPFVERMDRLPAPFYRADRARLSKPPARCSKRPRLLP